MKPLSLPFTLLLLISLITPLTAQWEPLVSGQFPINHRVWDIQYVDASTIWAFSSYDAFPPPAVQLPFVHRSTDGGATWQRYSIAGQGGIQARDISPVDSLTAYVALPNSGLYRTQNGGVDWEEITVSSDFSTFFFVHFFNENEGWVFGRKANQHPVSATTADGGATWTVIDEADMPPYLSNEYYGPGYATNDSYAVVDDIVVISASLGYYWKSTDKGQSWERVSTPASNQGLGMTGIAMKDESTIMLVVGYNASSNIPTVTYTTTDGGATWHSGSPGVTPGTLCYVPGTDGTFIICGHNSFIAANKIGTALSYDFGQTWSYIDNTRLVSMDFLDDGTGVAALGRIVSWGTQGEVYTWNGGSLRAPIFVNDDATGLNNGASWADAFNSLQSALAVASDGGQIWVAEGAYLPGNTPTSTFLINKNIHLYGGFAGTEVFLGQRGNPAGHPTILSGDVNGDDVADDFVANRGDNVMTVVEIAPGISNATVIDGFTIRNGHADGAWPQGKGAGILSTGAPVIRNCLFTQNYAEEQGGAILHNTTSTQSIIIEACIFDKNAGRFGGAVDVYYSGYRIDNCTFSGNVAEWELGNGVGGGLLINGASGAITNCTFENNAADKGGGIFVSSWVDVNDVTLVLENSTFDGNTAAVSGGGLGLVLTDSIQAAVRNCIFQNNSCVSGAGVGISVFEGGDFTENADILFENCLMAGNEGEEGTIHLSKAGTLKLLNCTIADNPAGGIVQNENSALALQNTILYNPGFTEYAGAAGNVTATSLGGNLIRDNSFAAYALPQDLQPMYDPQAMFMGDDDYHLHPGSPCINRGVNDGLTALYDLDGEDRIQHGIVDIGAYESPFVTSAREAIAGEIGLSPNPTTNFLYLQLPENIAQPIEVSLYDPNGKRMGTQALSSGQALEVKGLAAGMYWAKAVVGGRVFTGRFSKF